MTVPCWPPSCNSNVREREGAEGTYDAVMDIVKNHYGAYGIGVEYVYTMVHGAPATKFPEYAVPALAGAHQ